MCYNFDVHVVCSFLTKMFYITFYRVPIYALDYQCFDANI